MSELDELRAENERLKALIMALGEKLWTVAMHLSRLAEKKEVTIPKIPHNAA